MISFDKFFSIFSLFCFCLKQIWWKISFFNKFCCFWSISFQKKREKNEINSIFLPLIYFLAIIINIIKKYFSNKFKNFQIFWFFLKQLKIFQLYFTEMIFWRVKKNFNRNEIFPFVQIWSNWTISLKINYLQKQVANTLNAW